MLALAVAAPAFASTTLTVHAFVKENFERARSDIPCQFNELDFTLTCFGRGNAGPAGPITSVVVFSETGITRTITLRDGSTIMTTEDYGEAVFPGRSHEAPGAFVSFGNPAFVNGTFEIVGGTGQLAGATGSGTIRQVLAGNTIQIWFDGTLTLP